MVFPKVNSGQRVKLSASYLNRLTDLANSPTGDLAPALSGNSQPHLVQVKNTTSANIIPQGILGLGDSLLTTDDDEMAFRFGKPILIGETPDPDVHANKFVITLNGLAVDEIGFAQIFGVTAVIIDILDADHKFATIAEESANDPTELLESSSTGHAFILYAETGPDSGGLGEVWAYVVLGGGAGGGISPMQSTGAIVDDTITGKKVNGDGSLSGADKTFLVVPDP